MNIYNNLAHLVVVAFLERRQFPLEFEGDLEVEVSVVPLVGLHGELADDFLAGLDGEVLVQVEDRLLPVGVPSLGGRGEACPLVAFRELDVEVCDEGMDIVVAANLSKTLQL